MEIIYICLRENAKPFTHIGLAFIIMKGVVQTDRVSAQISATML